MPSASRFAMRSAVTVALCGQLAAERAGVTRMYYGESLDEVGPR